MANQDRLASLYCLACVGQVAPPVAPRNSTESIKLPGSRMHFWQIKGRSLPPSGTGTISKGAQLALSLCGLHLGIGSVLLVSSGTMATPNATASNPDEPSGGQVRRKAPPAMVWIPGGAFLMGTNDKESFPNERPAHLDQVESFHPVVQVSWYDP